MAFHVEDVEEAAAAIKVGHVRHQGGICLFFHFGNPLENYGRCHMCAAVQSRSSGIVELFIQLGLKFPLSLQFLEKDTQLASSMLVKKTGRQKKFCSHTCLKFSLSLRSEW